MYIPYKSTHLLVTHLVLWNMCVCAHASLLLHDFSSPATSAINPDPSSCHALRFESHFAVCVCVYKKESEQVTEAQWAPSCEWAQVLRSHMGVIRGLSVSPSLSLTRETSFPTQPTNKNITPAKICFTAALRFKSTLYSMSCAVLQLYVSEEWGMYSYKGVVLHSFTIPRYRLESLTLKIWQWWNHWNICIINYGFFLFLKLSLHCKGGTLDTEAACIYLSIYPSILHITISGQPIWILLMVDTDILYSRVADGRYKVYIFDFTLFNLKTVNITSITIKLKCVIIRMLFPKLLWPVYTECVFAV